MKHRPGRHDDRGQVVTALAVLVVLGLCLVTVKIMLPIGRAGDLRERAQAAADAAALAAAGEVRKEVLRRWSQPLADVDAVADWVSCDVGSAAADDYAGRNDARVTRYCYATATGRAQVQVQGLTSINGGRPLAGAEAQIGIAWGSCRWLPDPVTPVVRKHFTCGSLDVPFLLDPADGRLTLDTTPGWLELQLVPTLVR
jgi:uncharacterized membrane protein